MRRFVGYWLLLFWAALAAALHVLLGNLAGAAASTLDGIGGLESTVALRAFVPDLVTVLLVATVGRLDRRDTLAIALVVALGRVAFTGSAPMAVLSGTVGTAFLADALRNFAELERPFLRVVSAGLGSFLYTGWLVFVDYVKVRDAVGSGSLAFGDPGGSSFGLPILNACATAACGLLFWPLFSGLPGLRRLRRRAF